MNSSVHSLQDQAFPQDGHSPRSYDYRLRHTISILTFLIPLVYAVVLSFSISDEWFWSDDPKQLAFVRNAPSVWSLLGRDSFRLFRPIKNLIFLGFLHLEPFGVKWCRTVGIAVGAASFFPVLACLRRLFRNERKALAAAAIWLLSPTLVSSAVWLSCLNIQIMAAFAALAIANHDAAWDGGTFHPIRIFLSIVFLVLALVSYECAVAVVPILLFFDVLIRPGRLRNSKARMAHIAYWMVVALYLLLRFLSGSRGNMGGVWCQAKRWQLIVSAPYFTMQHFSNWFWPFGRFTVFGGYKWGDVSFQTLAGCGLLAAVAFMLVLLMRKRQPILCFCILFAGIGFVPVGNWFGLGNGPYGDYYLTLSSIGIAAGCVETADVFRHSRGAVRGPALVVVLLFIISRMATVIESAYWAMLWSDGALAFSASIRNYPEVRSNRIAIAGFLRNEDHFTKALELAEKVEKSNGDDWVLMANIHLARAIHAINVEHNAERAMEFIDKATSADTSGILVTLSHFYRGCVFEDVCFNVATAEQEYELALSGEWEDYLVPCADRLARLKAIRGERDEAIALWERAMKLDPKNTAVLWNLSIAYHEAGNDARSNELRKKVRQLSEK